MNELALSLAENINSIARLSPMHEWGLSVIRAFQSVANPVLTILARFFTLLGDPITYLLLIPIVFWCIDEKRGFKIGLTVFISNGLNVAIKENLKVLRPFYHDPSVKLAEQAGYSTPSGHSQNSATLWPIFLANKKTAGKRDLRLTPLNLLLALMLPTLIGLSRIYLGVHYPTDVFFGWALGVVFSIFYILVLPLIEYKISEISQSVSPKTHSYKSIKLAGVAAVAFLLNAFSGTDSSMGGLIFGFAAGYILLTDTPLDAEKPKVVFNAHEGSLIKKTARLMLGLSILGVIYFGLKMVFPGEESSWYTLCRFLRYGAGGFWASWGAPRVFILTGLSKNDQ